jgi:MoaA/NifB/PqqE/SkfB family radical SAM enzyme
MREEKTHHPVSLLEKTMLKIPNDASQYHVKLVHFSGGGEPLAHPSTRMVAKELRLHGVKVALSTNGMFLKPLDAELFDHIRVSVDAATSETFWRTKHGNFKKVIDNIRELIRYRNKHQLSVDIGLGYVVTLENFDEILAFVGLGKKLDCDFIHFRPCYYRDERKSLQLKTQFSTIAPRMEGLASKNEKPRIFWVSYKFRGHWTPRSYRVCRATPLQAVLSASGEFIVCQDVFIRFGDYNKQSFEEVWFGEEHKKAMENINITTCPRCVETFHNEVIEHMFLSNECRNELI